jgi:hypothetical protein
VLLFNHPSWPACAGASAVLPLRSKKYRPSFLAPYTGQFPKPVLAKAKTRAAGGSGFSRSPVALPERFPGQAGTFHPLSVFKHMNVFRFDRFCEGAKQ